MSQQITVNLGSWADYLSADGEFSAIRQAGSARLQAVGLPNGRVASWEHTPTKPLLVGKPLAKKSDAIAKTTIDAVAIANALAKVVFVDGKFAPERSDLHDLEGVSVTPLQPADLEGVDFAAIDGVTALNLATIQSGAKIVIGRDVVLSKPIHIQHFHTSPETATSTWHEVTIESGSNATIVETWAGEAAGTTTLHTTNLVAKANSTLHHVKVQTEAATAVHKSRLMANIASGAHVDSFVWSEGAAWSRCGTDLHMSGEGSSCEANGLYLGQGEQLHDIPTRLDHQKAHTTSAELYKGILDDKSRGIFLGNVVVQRDAQKVDSQQTNRNLLLSKKAKVDTTPQLEIHADDVKCAHGSTVGQLDPDALFFLQARGISGDHARLLLTKAFAGEVIGKLDNFAVRTKLERRLEDWFSRGGQ